MVVQDVISYTAHVWASFANGGIVPKDVAACSVTGGRFCRTSRTSCGLGHTALLSVGVFKPKPQALTPKP